MAKGGGSTRTVSANNASASRTSSSASAKLPKDWALDYSMNKPVYRTDVKLNDQARYSLREIYGSQLSFGAGEKGDIINVSDLQLAKNIAKDGKNLTDLFKSYNNAKTSENEKFYANEIRRYIAEAKQKRSK